MFRDRPRVLEDILEGLFHVALADGRYHEGEEEFLAAVAEIFGVAPVAFDAIEARHLEGRRARSWQVLGLPRDADLADGACPLARPGPRPPPRQDDRPRPAAGDRQPGNARLAQINRAWEELSARLRPPTRGDLPGRSGRACRVSPPRARGFHKAANRQHRPSRQPCSGGPAVPSAARERRRRRVRAARGSSRGAAGRPVQGCARATASSISTPRPGLLRRQHVAGLPAHRPLQQLGVEAAAGADALEDQEVRDRQRELDRRRPGDRPGVEVRRDLRPEPLGRSPRSCAPRAARRPARGSAAGSPTPPARSSVANSALVVSRSPAAIGTGEAAATAARSSGRSGGTGSSNQSGS